MRRLSPALLIFLVAACADVRVSGPAQHELVGTNLTFFQFETSAFAAAEKSGSFWAVKGQDRDITLRYTDTGAPFLHFTVGANSLGARPDGSTFQPGDSVLITVAVDASGRMSYAFEPSGLRFDANDPARLELSYSRADALSRLLGLPLIYERDSALLPWVPLSTLNLSDVAQSDIRHFTDFALAVN